MGTSQKSTAVTPILPQLVAQGRMSALETESARLLAPEDDGKMSWRTKSASWRTVGAGVMVRT